jgi:tRNA-Thr(GGU) m(6)t(6)A37 methyltransferase TsaA
MNISYRPIGIIRSSYQEPAGMPIQAIAAIGVPGHIELDPACEAGLQDISGFSHLLLLYHLHLIQGFSLTVTPFLDNQSHGVFATRSPKRPNPIGLSIVRLVRVEGCILHLEDVDIVDGTPLLDIKPYVPAFDVRRTNQIGWLEKKIDQLHQTRADQRF